MKTHLNLLPYDHLRGGLVRRRACQWSIVTGGTLVLVLAMGWSQRASYTTMSDQLKSLEVAYEPIQQLKTESVVLRKKLAESRQREAITLRLAVHQPVLTVLGIVSAAAKQCDGHVAVNTLAITRQETANRHAQNRPGKNIVTLDGIADDDAAIARFADALRTGRVFKQVSLRKTGNHEISAVKVRSYSIECSY